MWASCIEQPPPYGLPVEIKYAGKTIISHRYIRRRRKEITEFTDYWMAKGRDTRIAVHYMKGYDWKVPEDLGLDIEEYEDD